MISVQGVYGEHEKFTYILSLVFFLCIFNTIVSKISKWNWDDMGGELFHWFDLVLIVRKSQRDSTPSVLYAFSSFTYLFAMLSSNYALEFVSYPMQVLGKSVKPVPVMLLGVVVARKRYSLAKYIYVLLIVLGMSNVNSWFFYSNGYFRCCFIHV